MIYLYSAYHTYNIYLWFLKNRFIEETQKHTFWYRDSRNLRDDWFLLYSHPSHLRTHNFLECSVFLNILFLHCFMQSFLMKNNRFFLTLEVLTIRRKQFVSCEYSRSQFTSTIKSKVLTLLFFALTKLKITESPLFMDVSGFQLNLTQIFIVSYRLINLGCN